MTGLGKHITHASGRMKTACTSAVLAAFEIHPDTYHYASCRNDVERILRSRGWSVRSRKSALGVNKRISVGGLRKALRKLGEVGLYYVSVPGHAMLMDHYGNTVVDTAPRLRDARQVLAVTKVTR